MTRPRRPPPSRSPHELPHRGTPTPARAGRETKEEEMPKQKTHSGAKKRCKVTGSGKLMKQQANPRHNFEGKPSRRTRRLSQEQVLAPDDAKVAKKLLGRRRAPTQVRNQRNG